MNYLGKGIFVVFLGVAAACTHVPTQLADGGRSPASLSSSERWDPFNDRPSIGDESCQEDVCPVEKKSQSKKK